MQHAQGLRIAQCIDHTLLRSNATEQQIRKLCAEAEHHGFWSVCVNPDWVTLCANVLEGSHIRISTTVGFPLGANLSKTKAHEAECAVRQGAHEVDLMLNLGALKSKDYKLVESDIRRVRKTVPSAVMKVILETCLLTDEEKVLACTIAQATGADFVKTSTGFSRRGATIKDVQLLRQTVASTMGVKASGGIRNFKTAQAMLSAGANRIGSSLGVLIVRQERESFSNSLS